MRSLELSGAPLTMQPQAPSPSGKSSGNQHPDAECVHYRGTHQQHPHRLHLGRCENNARRGVARIPRTMGG